MAKAVPAINEPFVNSEGIITDVWYKYLLSLGYSDSNGGNGGGSDSTSFLKFEFDDHIRNNLSWLRADTFSWQDGGVYVGVYEHLLEDIEGKELQSETIGGITIQYYLADDMHKICPATEEIPIMNLYNNIGIAWYYIIDADNKFFKLPRTKWGFTGLRDAVGKYVPETLPNIRGSGIWSKGQQGTGAIVSISSDRYAGTSSYATAYFQKFDASAYSSTYQDDALVQQRATQMYLYFYVGDADSDDVRKIASANLEKLNSKADADLNNVSVPHLISRTTNSDGITIEEYSDGYVCMRGYSHKDEPIGSNSGKYIAVDLPITMRDTNYELFADKTDSTGNQYAQVDLSPVRTSITQITLKFYNNSTVGSAATVMRACWEVKGYKANS